MLMGDTKRRGLNSKQAAKSVNEAIKQNSIYNRANIIAANMDFATAAEEYSKALRIDPDDFKAKKNLERMRLDKSNYQHCSPLSNWKEKSVFSL